MLMQLHACILFEHRVPGWFLLLIRPQVGDDLPREDFNRGRFSYPVLTKDPDAASFFWDRESIQSESVFPELMDKVFLEFLSKSDDLDSLERAFIDADTAADTEILRDDRFAVLSHYDGF